MINRWKMFRYLVIWGIPISMAGVAVYRRGWNSECPAPCFDVVTAPVTESFAHASGVAGVGGQIVLVLVVLVWALFFVGPLVRGPV